MLRYTLMLLCGICILVLASCGGTREYAGLEVVPVVEDASRGISSAVQGDCNRCPPEVEDCGECEGKVTELTLRWNGSSAANITVTAKKTGTVFSGNVPAGGTFSFSGNDKNGTLGTEITVTANGQSTDIHTSCSQPIGVGMNFGAFTVVAGASLKGGPLCGDTNPPCKDCPSPGDCGKCEGKVTELTLEWNGSSAANITVTAKKTGTVFSGNVPAGGTFSFSGNDKNGTLGTEITVTANGQSTDIHTSCSQPIGPDMDFGPFTVVAGRSLKGGALCPGEDNDNGSCSKCGKKDCYKFNKYYDKYLKKVQKYGCEKAVKYLEKANKYRSASCNPPGFDPCNCPPPPPPCVKCSKNPCGCPPPPPPPPPCVKCSKNPCGCPPPPPPPPPCVKCSKNPCGCPPPPPPPPPCNICGGKNKNDGKDACCDGNAGKGNDWKCGQCGSKTCKDKDKKVKRCKPARR